VAICIPRQSPRYGHVLFPSITGSLDLTLDPALAEAAGHQHACEPLKDFLRSVTLDGLGVHFLNFNSAIVGDPTMDDCFVNGFVGVLEFDVFADHPDANPVLWGDDFSDDFLPVGHIRQGGIQVQLAADQVIHSFPLQHKGHFVDAVIDVLFFDHRFVWDVAEKRNLLAQFLVEGFLAAANQDMRRDTDFAQFRD
jgi:hypothetical protein